MEGVGGSVGLHDSEDNTCQTVRGYAVPLLTHTGKGQNIGNATRMVQDNSIPWEISNKVGSDSSMLSTTDSALHMLMRRDSLWETSTVI
jgi:hypothetical protein